MEQARIIAEQLKIEANIQRKKVSEVAKEWVSTIDNLIYPPFSLIEYCEKEKTNDCLLMGPSDHNPFQEKKSCCVL